MKYKGKQMTKHRIQQLKKHKERLDKWRYYNIILPNNLWKRLEDNA